jgi:hypothetical protein
MKKTVKNEKLSIGGKHFILFGPGGMHGRLCF